MSVQTAWQATFDFGDNRPIVVEPSAARLTSDAGLLPLRQFDEHIGLTRQRRPPCCNGWLAGRQRTSAKKVDQTALSG